MLRPAFRLVAFVLGALLLAPTSSIAAPSATTLPQVPAESLPTLPSPAPPAEITPTCGAFCESAGIAPRTVSGNYHLDAWGNYRNPEELEASKNRFGFTGHLFDRETGTYYAKARYFDPGLGRFLSQDTYLGEIDNPPSIHRYTWAHNRPTYFVDPTGNIVVLSNFQKRIDEFKQGIVDRGTAFAEYAGRNQALRTFGLDRKIAEHTGRLAGLVGAASDVVGATNFGINVVALGLAQESTLGQEAAVELGESYSATEKAWKVVSTDPLGVATRALNSAQETHEAAMRGDHRAIAEVNEQAARIAVDLALGSKGTTAAVRGTRETVGRAVRAQARAGKKSSPFKSLPPNQKGELAKSWSREAAVARGEHIIGEEVDLIFTIDGKKVAVRADVLTREQGSSVHVYVETKFSGRAPYTDHQRIVIPELVRSGDGGLVAEIGRRAGSLRAGQKIRVVFQGDVWDETPTLLGQ